MGMMKRNYYLLQEVEKVEEEVEEAMGMILESHSLLHIREYREDGIFLGIHMTPETQQWKRGEGESHTALGWGMEMRNEATSYAKGCPEEKIFGGLYTHGETGENSGAWKVNSGQWGGNSGD